MIRTFTFLALFSALIPVAGWAQPNKDCRAMPSFTGKAGFDPSKSYFSTSERKQMGLVFMEMSAKAGDAPRSWKHDSWKNAGWLGPMVITDKGEIWVAPVPLVNLLANKPEEQNRIWKVDGKTAEMKVVIDLPRPDSVFDGQNPFGLLGLAYDCDNSVIYATSVSGSTMMEEKGRIFAINTKTLEIISRIDSLDAFGAGVGTINGEKRLYFGAARNGNILSVKLGADGRFEGENRLELSLEGVGPRGDDRARKIRFAPDGTLTVHGVEFYYNLTAPTEKQETAYQFKMNPATQKWQLTRIN